MKFLTLFLVLLTVTAFTACAGPAGSGFVGCYAFKENGKSELKITEDGGKYFVLVREGQGWSKPEELHTGSIEEIKPLWGDDSERIKANLIANKGAFGIFRVTPGEVYGGKKAVTENFAFVIFGGGPVYKSPCE